jgi:hypothetical protein
VDRQFLRAQVGEFALVRRYRLLRRELRSEQAQEPRRGEKGHAAGAWIGAGAVQPRGNLLREPTLLFLFGVTGRDRVRGRPRPRPSRRPAPLGTARQDGPPVVVLGLMPVFNRLHMPQVKLAARSSLARKKRGAAVVCGHDPVLLVLHNESFPTRSVPLTRR